MEISVNFSIVTLYTLIFGCWTLYTYSRRPVESRVDNLQAKGEHQLSSSGSVVSQGGH